jgi:hypothetical protein
MNDSLESIRAMAHGQLSVKSRVGYVALLLAATGMSVVIVSLWLTEPVLPARTQLAFALMTAIGLSWVALASWVLSARRPLFARDRVIAGRMAVGFTALFTIGAGVAAAISGSVAAFGALATGVVMAGFAVGAWRAARRRFDELAARRSQLEELLRQQGRA